MFGGDKLRMLCLRNPWGTFEWNGDWSDKSDLWNKHPKVKKACKFVDCDDGKFWIEWKDFKTIFTSIQICERSVYRDLVLDVREQEGCVGVCKGCVMGCASFYCCCQGFRHIYL